LTLKKKSNAIAYHFVREGVARDEWRTAYVNSWRSHWVVRSEPSLFGWFCIMFSQRKGMGIWEEIKSFLLPPRIGTTYPFAHRVWVLNFMLEL
jgi:hypothetical protein